MTDDLKELFRALDALEFPHGTAPPTARSVHPAIATARPPSLAAAAFALVLGTLAVGFAISAFEGDPTERTPPTTPSGVAETGPGTCDHGPWIRHCPEADWARTVVDVAGLEVVEEQAVLVVGAPGSGEYLFWAMDPSLHGGVTPFPEVVADGVARRIDRVDGVPVYGFRSSPRLWLWSHEGLNVWVDGRAPLTAPSQQDLVALVRASRSVAYAGEASGPQVVVPDIVGLRDQPALLSLDDVGLSWIVSNRTVEGVDPWRVVSVDPAPGTDVERGSAIRVLIASEVTPLPEGAAEALDCDAGHREAFGGPRLRIMPGGSAYITGNLSGIGLDDEVVQVTSEPGDEWAGLWHVIRSGSVVAVVDFDSLDGVACQGSGVAGA
jgi:hypothetical protein